MTGEDRDAFRLCAEALRITDSEAMDQAIRLWTDQLRADLQKDLSSRKRTAKEKPQKPAVTGK